MQLNKNRQIPKTRPAAPAATPKTAVNKPAAAKAVTNPKADMVEVKQVKQPAATPNTKGATTSRTTTAKPNKAADPKPETKIEQDPAMVESDSTEETSQDQEPKGIKLNDKYIIQTLDVLNVTLLERYAAQVKPGEEDQPVKYLWKIVGYHPNIELAWKNVVNREINLTVNQGLEAIVQRVEELKKLKKKLEGK